MSCLHQCGSVNPALPWQAARSSYFLLTLLPGCLRWKCTAWLECCFSWHFAVMLSMMVLGRARGFERVKMHLEPAPGTSRHRCTKDNGHCPGCWCFNKPEHLTPLPRHPDQNGQLNPLWETGRASKLRSQVLGRDGGKSEHEGELVRPGRVCVHGVCRGSMLCPPGQKEARRIQWTSSTGRRGTLIPSHECFHCL